MSQRKWEIGIVVIIALLVGFHLAVVVIYLTKLGLISLIMWVPDVLILGLCALWWSIRR